MQHEIASDGRLVAARIWRHRSIVMRRNGSTIKATTIKPTNIAESGIARFLVKAR